MMKALTFLLVYTFSLTLLLYSFGVNYNISGFTTFTLPNPPDESDVFGRVWYGFTVMWSFFVAIVNIPYTAYITVIFIASQYPAIAIFITLPAMICLITIVVSLLRLVRGTTGF